MKTVTNVMANAWKIAGFAQAKFGGKVREYFAESMRLAWAFEKKENPAKYAPKAQAEKNVPRETMPKKEANKNVPRETKAPKAKKEVEAEFANSIIPQSIPFNIRTIFGDKIADTVSEFTYRFAEQANKAGQCKHEDANAYRDGMNALAKVENFQELQATMCAFFLRNYITKVAKKFIQFGIGYKLRKKPSFEEIGQYETGETLAYTDTKTGETKDATVYEVDYASNETRYADAPSNAGNITQYDADDITQEVITVSYEKIFSESMFDAPQNVMYSLFCRISNAVQKMMNQLRRETQVRTKNGMYIQAPKSTIDNALWLVEEMGTFGEEEAQVLKLALQGFQKKEIDKMVGKRTDRTFKRIEKQYAMA